MQLTKNGKTVIDAMISNEPDLQGLFYTLDYIISLPDINHLDTKRFLGIISDLVMLGCVKYEDKQHTVISLCERGVAYKEIKNMERRQIWAERLWGFLTGTLLTSLAWYLASFI